jgi:hypothetical protein
MDGNKTTEVFELMCEEYGMNAMCCETQFDYEEAIFSNGFIHAMENGMMPILGSEREEHERKRNNEEYHHFIHEGECYVVYFKEIN